MIGANPETHKNFTLAAFAHGINCKQTLNSIVCVMLYCTVLYGNDTLQNRIIVYDTVKVQRNTDEEMIEI